MSTAPLSAPLYGHLVRRAPASIDEGNRELMTAMAETMEVCRALSERGCRLLSAHCHAGRADAPEPRVVIDRPPLAAYLDGGVKISRPHTLTLATRIGSVQVEWTERRGGVQ